MATSNVERILDVALKFNENEFLGHSIPFPGTYRNQLFWPRVKNFSMRLKIIYYYIDKKGLPRVAKVTIRKLMQT